MITSAIDPHDLSETILLALTWLAWWPVCGLLLLAVLVIAWRSGRAADCPALVIAAGLAALGDGRRPTDRGAAYG